MDKSEQTESEQRIYELGYHLVPIIAEEGIMAEVASLKALVEKEGGEISAEGKPVLSDLAYEISKTVKAVKSNYTKSYFGWMKFSVSPEGVLNIKKAIDASDSMLRYLILSSSEQEETPVVVTEEGEAKVELDKTIDELVIN